MRRIGRRRPTTRNIGHPRTTVRSRPSMPRSRRSSTMCARPTARRSSYFEAMGGTLNRGWAPLAGVLVDREKYIDLPIAERYDLAADAAERTNLAGRSPERDRTLATSLRAFNARAPGERQAESAD